MGATHSILSALAANRKQFFDLVIELEKSAGTEVDELKLQAEIDSNHHGQESLSAIEAQDVLVKVARPKVERACASG